MEESIQEAARLIASGGWLMIPLAALGALIYYSLFQLSLHLRVYNYSSISEDVWGHYVDAPHDGEGPLGDLIRYIGDQARNAHLIRSRMAEVRDTHVRPSEQRLLFATVLIGTAPLTGLLGTVMGMLATFVGLSISTGGQTLDLVAGGISEALITTQTGLVLAIPAYVIRSNLKKQIDELNLFFNQLEIAMIMKLERDRAHRTAERAAV